MTTNRVSRRTVVRTAIGVGATAAFGAGASPVSAQSADLSSWFSNTSNFEGVVDETGQDEVTVTVGASGNGGSFAFGPAAVRVDPGTTVVWKWNGDGGSHNVVADDGTFESEMVGTSGHTFSYTFEETGVWRYACAPHEAMGMKGAVVVGDVSVAGGSGTAGKSTAAASGGDRPAELESWFSNTGNYEGVVDETGQEEVTVTVGASGNGASFAFGPAAVRVDPGTTVVWEWSGRGGSHNVVADDGSFESALATQSGHTFSHTFEERGTYTYLCTPHETLGMKGAVVVGGGDGGAGGGGESSSSLLGGVSDSTLLFGGSLLGALLSPVAVAVMVALGDDGDPPEGRDGERGRTYGHPSD